MAKILGQVPTGNRPRPTTPAGEPEAGNRPSRLAHRGSPPGAPHRR
jgi:hypothetical protein